MADRGASEPWHMDKRIPVALIVTIALQTGTAVWWAASQNAATAQNRADLTRHAQQIDALSRSVTEQTVAGARVQQELVSIQQTLSRLDRGQEQTLEMLRRLMPPAR